MMRSPHAWAIACRKPSGEVSTHSEPLERLSEKRKWMAWPVIRGVVTLGHAMTLGFRALKFSANVALDELQPEPAAEKKKLEITGWMAAVNIIISVGFFIFMYKFLPLLAATEMKRVNPLFGEQIVFNLVDGVIRIALFLLFIWGVSAVGAQLLDARAAADRIRLDRPVVEPVLAGHVTRRWRLTGEVERLCAGLHGDVAAGGLVVQQVERAHHVIGDVRSAADHVDGLGRRGRAGNADRARRSEHEGEHHRAERRDARPAAVPRR